MSEITTIRNVGSSETAAPYDLSPEIEVRIATEPDEVEAHFELRHQVFVREQGIFPETDRDEHDENGILLIACRRGRIVGAVRCYPVTMNVWYGGRLAVHPDYRKYDIGVRLVRKAVETVMNDPGVKHFLATVQIQNVRFFKRLGWISIDQPFLMKGRRHQLMEKPLNRCSQ